MLLRDKLIAEIKELPVSDLVVIQQIVSALSAHRSPPIKNERTHLDTRQALRHCSGSLADEIVQNREDRF